MVKKDVSLGAVRLAARKQLLHLHLAEAGPGNLQVFDLCSTSGPIQMRILLRTLFEMCCKNWPLYQK